ncbi:hypothetical protein K469DRAFT_693628 [Zopfia rhizophila CBS 207.26]|uniref:Uncharacterized protein n=1 Tax=Zopfia rhizophila CBS 207.26 TaxID=1314779 RepID=A0A6A6DLE6_9PEZI|nr:hypothetical protein K469DRAFT_693628 [Zopfia rhizophila CBS 207.26]
MSNQPTLSYLAYAKFAAIAWRLGSKCSPHQNPHRKGILIREAITAHINVYIAPVSPSRAGSTAKRKNSTAGSNAPAKKNPTRQAQGQRASRLQNETLTAPSTRKITAPRAGGAKKPGGPANCLRVKFMPTRKDTACEQAAGDVSDNLPHKKE